MKENHLSVDKSLKLNFTLICAFWHMIQKFKELSDADIQNPFHYHRLVNINDVSQHLSLIKHKIGLSSS